MSRHGIIGSVVAGFDTKTEIDVAVSETFQLLTDNAVVVLDNAQLYSGLERTNEELQQTLDELTSTQVKLEKSKEKVARLEILIDEKKKSKKISAIVDSEYFDSLKDKANKLRGK